MAGLPPGTAGAKGWQTPPVHDPATRERVWRALLALTAAGILVATIILFAPTFFDDEVRARFALATILVGVAACGLARLVVIELRENLVEKSGLTTPRISPLSGSWYAEWLGEQVARQASRPLFEVHTEMERAEPRLRLTGVDLREAILPGADLRNTELTGADLRGTDLRGADLRWTDLRGTDLRGSALDEARLEGAVYDESTNWPMLAAPPRLLGAVHAEEVD